MITGTQQTGNKKEVKQYKLTELPSRPIPDAVLYVKEVGEDSVTTYITDTNGVPYKLYSQGESSDGIQTLVNSDGTLTVTGTTDLNIKISDEIAQLINNALASGDNVSSLVNDSGYITQLELDEYELISNKVSVLSTSETEYPNCKAVADAIADIDVDLTPYEEKSNKATTLTNSTTDYPTTSLLTEQLALKANIDSPTFTGTVSGITSSMVGLGDVDNTTDLLKPISTATQTALDLKEDKSSKVSILSTSEIEYPNCKAVTEELDLKLDSADYNDRFKGVYLTETALNLAYPTSSIGDYAQVNEVGATNVINYNWDAEEGIWVENATSGAGANNTDELPEGSSNLYWTVARFLENLTLARVVSALGFTPENVANKVTTLTDSDTDYPSTSLLTEKLALKEDLINKVTVLEDSNITYPDSSVLYGVDSRLQTVEGVTSVENGKIPNSKITSQYGNLGEITNQNLASTTTYTAGYFINWLTGVSTINTTYSHTDYIPVKAGEKYRWYQKDTEPNDDGNAIGALYGAYYDESGVFVSGMNITTTDTVITVPSGVSSVRVTYSNSANAGNFYFYRVLNYTSYGDSITAQNTWQPLLSEYLSLYHTVDGYGGARIAGSDTTALNQDTRLLTISSTADIITVMGGTNDWAASIELGEETSTDVETFYGALNSLFYKLKTNYPNALIIALATPYGEYPDRVYFDDKVGILNNEGLSTVDYGNALITAAKNNHVRFVATHKLWDTDNITNFITYDGAYLHPNTLGGIELASKISLDIVQDVIRLRTETKETLANKVSVIENSATTYPSSVVVYGIDERLQAVEGSSSIVTDERILNTVLANIVTTDDSDVDNTDTIEEAIGKLQAKSESTSTSNTWKIVACYNTWTLTTLNTWYSWNKYSSYILNATPNVSLGTGSSFTVYSFIDNNFIPVIGASKLLSLDLSMRNVVGSYTLQFYLASFDISYGDINRGYETNYQVLINETFTIGTANAGWLKSLTIATHTLNTNSGLVMAVRCTSTASPTLQEPTLTFKFQE